MTSKYYRAPLLHYIKLCASSQTSRWIQTGVTVRKRSMRVKISDFFVPCDLEIWWMTLKNNRAPLLCYIKLCASFQSHGWIRWSYSPETHNSGQNPRFFVPCDLEIRSVTLKNNRAPLLCRFKLCASFHSHRWIKAKVTVWKCSIRVKIGNFLSCVTLKFNEWPWKTLGHLFYATSSFVHHFVAIGEFKLELQSGNAQFGSKLMIFWAVWPWNLTDDLEKRQGTSPKQPKLYVSFHNHMWIKTGGTVWKRLSWVMTSVTLTFDLWPWTFAWTSLLSLVITPDNFVMIRWQEHSEKVWQTDRRTARRTDRLKEVFVELLGRS